MKISEIIVEGWFGPSKAELEKIKWEKSRAEWKEKYETPSDREYEKKLDASVKQSADEKKKERERNRRMAVSGLLDKAWDGALLGAEYRSLERQYKENRHKMSYAQTRRMEELYNRGFR